MDSPMFAGVKPSILSFMIPLLKPSYVARRIVYAIRQNEVSPTLNRQEMVIIPWTLNVITPLKYLLPTNMYDALQKLTGTSSGMENFVGHGAGGKK